MFFKAYERYNVVVIIVERVDIIVITLMIVYLYFFLVGTHCMLIMTQCRNDLQTIRIDYL